MNLSAQSCIHSILSLTFILLLGFSVSLRSDEMPPHKDNDITEIVIPIRIRNERLPSIKGLPQDRWLQAGTFKESGLDDATVAEKLSVSEWLFPPPVHSEARIFYPTLKKGDIVPMGGAVCRFTGLKQTSRWQAHFDVIPEERLPGGFRHPRDQHAVPLGGEIGSYAMGGLSIREITESNGEKQPLSVAVRHKFTKTDRTVTPPKESEVQEDLRLRVGDTFLGGTYNAARPAKYVIVAIVPPDAERRIVGWILIEPAK